ncbi:hypothetical protein K504DRAFT_294404 [Pleomassaria siparia CBS 279.74]|uniref:Uncharacterized protein n=1 Tax=Pleomassaria siparia CBS 279.74 TaxID=1314801 RepID=A0A6G1K825_9PLEO|nr:hypothetical protein K504DRAFT_294404 [Pleomassaria siparia CBS 279.74]
MFAFPTILDPQTLHLLVLSSCIQRIQFFQVPHLINFHCLGTNLSHAGHPILPCLNEFGFWHCSVWQQVVHKHMKQKRVCNQSIQRIYRPQPPSYSRCGALIISLRNVQTSRNDMLLPLLSRKIRFITLSQYMYIYILPRKAPNVSDVCITVSERKQPLSVIQDSGAHLPGWRISISRS